MNSILKYLLGFILCFVFCSANNLVSGQDVTDVSFKDDPVAAALDSLVQLNVFEKYTKPYATNSNYKFSPDSIPVYDDATIMERLEKLDAQSPFDFFFNGDRKSTRLNSSHGYISYAVF